MRLKDRAQQHAFEKSCSPGYVQFIRMRTPQESHIPSAPAAQQKYHPGASYTTSDGLVLNNFNSMIKYGSFTCSQNTLL